LNVPLHGLGKNKVEGVVLRSPDNVLESTAIQMEFVEPMAEPREHHDVRHGEGQSLSTITDHLQSPSNGACSAIEQPYPISPRASIEAPGRDGSLHILTGPMLVATRLDVEV
jgi:hypothetical protein